MRKNAKAIIHDVPDYATVKEIVVTGAEKGGDKKQYMFLDKNKKECERSFRQTWDEISAIGSFLYNIGVTKKQKG